jgi:hypothetical protein
MNMIELHRYGDGCHRFKDALEIQQGASNMIAISRTLVRAIEQWRDERPLGTIEADPAVRLIVHQMAHLCAVDEINTGLFTYSQLTDECEREVWFRMHHQALTEATTSAIAFSWRLSDKPVDFA